MHCNLRPSEPRQSVPALITTPCQVWSRIRPIAFFCCWYITIRCVLDLWHLNLNIYSVSPVRWLNSVPNLSAIEQSAAEFAITVSVFDLMTLNIALRIALGSVIIFTKFDLMQLIRGCIVAFFMLIRYVTLWPWPLTRWPWTFVVHRASRDQSLYEV